METKDKEREILQKALEEFQKRTNLNAQIQYGNYDFDAILRIELNEMEWNFAAEVKKTVTPGTLGVFGRQLRIFPQKQKGLLITWYVTPQMADRMKKLGIQFIDTAGNAYIDEPPLFIFIKGNRPIDRYPIEQPMRAFQPMGLKVVFALLCNPGLENEPFRKIAKVANAALGTVSWVIKDLKNIGHLIDRGKQGRHLIRKKGLLERWVDMYPARLRPKNIVGRYRAPDIDWWKNEELADLTAYWGGEVAAHKLDPYLKPQIVTIYTDQPIGELLLTHKMKKDPKGDIQIFKVFWHFEFHWQWHGLYLVPPLLIYADLLATGDPRNIETADTIYGQHLAQLVQEDR